MDQKAEDLRKGLWVTDAELIRRSGVPEKIMRRNLREYDAKPQLGFPRKFKAYGDRRYWPAVMEYFAKLNERIFNPRPGIPNQK